MKLRLIPFFLIFYSVNSSANECEWWQTQVKATTVKQHTRESHSVSSHSRKAHCRATFPKVEKWHTQFSDKLISDWPIKGEAFKSWAQTEKEIILQILSEQPLVFRNFNDVKFFRGEKSKHKNNPSTTVKTLNAITLYDDFFKSSEKSRIISHEMAHLYLHHLDKEKIANFAYELGWRENPKNGALVHLPNYSLLKSDSDQSLTEDITNHLEDYLHEPKKLNKKFPTRYKMIRELVSPDFKLEKP